MAQVNTWRQDQDVRLESLTPIVIEAGADPITVDRISAIFTRTFNIARRRVRNREQCELLAAWVQACEVPAKEQFLKNLRDLWLRLQPCLRCGGTGQYEEAGVVYPDPCFRCQGSGIDNPHSPYPARFRKEDLRYPNAVQA